MRVRHRTLLMLVPLALLAMLIAPAWALPTLTRIANLPFPVSLSSVDVADYDRDGDLDLAVAGLDTLGQRRTRIYTGSAGGTVWTANASPLVGVSRGCVRWCDYDGDGQIDLLVMGDSGAGYVSVLYHNNGGTFANSGITLPTMNAAAAVWGDVDNDGRPDLVVSGISLTGAVCYVLHNNVTSFTTVQTLQGIGQGSVDLADMDRDGDLDLVSTGVDAFNVAKTIVYRNTNGTFADTNAGLVGLQFSTARWGDYDNDGVPDLGLMGTSGGTPFTLFARGKGDGTFFAPVSLAGFNATNGSLSWGDIDSDGLLDLLTSGQAATRDTSWLTLHPGTAAGVYVPGLPGLHGGEIAMADLARDFSPDVVMTGVEANTGRTVSAIYRTGNVPVNSLPGTPALLSVTTAVVNGEPLTTFTWSRTTDDHTPRGALTYELRIGTSTNSAQITGVSYDPTTGARYFARPGAQGSDTTWSVALPPGTYHWSVQAVDGANIGGTPANDQTFTVQPWLDSGFALTQVSGVFGHGAVAWGDFDGDGKLDLAITGRAGGGAASDLYQKVGGTLVSLGSRISAFADGDVAWGDYDGDGKLDVAMAGALSGAAYLEVGRGSGTGFFPGLSLLPTGFTQCTLAWVDYDGDGDLDLAVCGSTNAAASGAMTKIYRNTNGTFTDSGIALTGVYQGHLAFADIDGDGDPDLFVVGLNTAGAPSAQLYLNTGGAFTPVASPMTPLNALPSFCFFDYDGDGRPDIAMIGSTNGSYTGGQVRIFHNDGGGAFSLLSTALPGGANASITTGDIDGDGDPDIVYSGYNTGGGWQLTIGRNDGGGAFTAVGIGLDPVLSGQISLGDVNGDGRLDLALVGLNALGQASTHVYLNFGGAANTPPTAPSAPVVTVDGDRTVVRWTKATDTQSSQNRLTYDVRIGLSPEGSQLAPGDADSLSGTRFVVRSGSFTGDSAVFTHLPDGKYYVAVQSIDPSFAGGAYTRTTADVAHLTEVGSGLASVSIATASSRPAAIAWGDYDGDNRQDLLVSVGSDAVPANAKTRLYRNVAGTLTAVPTSLPNLASGSVAWGDYDRDGDLDVVVAGIDSTGTTLTRIYRNDGNGVFTKLPLVFTPLSSVTLAWADFDNDGDLDLVGSGLNNNTPLSGEVIFFRNQGSDFFTELAPITTVGSVNGQLAVGDVNGDGRPDVVSVGTNSSGAVLLDVLRNQGSFNFSTSLVAGFGLRAASLALCDYDNDGDLDIALMGSTDGAFANGRLYILDNNGTGTFTVHGTSLLNVSSGRLAWGDFDGDGDADLSVVGVGPGVVPVTCVVRNDGGGAFSVIDAGLPAYLGGTLAWGALDADHRLELGLVGSDGANVSAHVYQHLNAKVNTPPVAPGNLNGTIASGRASLHWTPNAGGSTPANGLTFDVRLGVSIGGGQIVPLPADSTTGVRRVARFGLSTADSAFVSNLPDNRYYFTVQAVDAALEGSALPAWQTLYSPGVLGVDDTPAALPTVMAIHAVAPNPARGRSEVVFDLPHTSTVDLAVFDISGRRVRTLLQANLAAGRQAARWNGDLEDGSPAGAGVYFVRLRADGHEDKRRLVLER